MKTPVEKKSSFGSKLAGFFKKEDKSPFKAKLSQMNASNNYIMNREVEVGKQQIVEDYKNHLKKSKGGAGTNPPREGSMLSASEDSTTAMRKSLA